MGIIWRFVVLLAAGWFLAGLILGHALPHLLPGIWVGISTGVCVALAVLWNSWSKGRLRA